jgi:hypothetical protein
MIEERHCPVCNNRIDANFGMVQCPQCQTVLFVDFSGNIVIGGSEEPSEDSVVDIELPMDSYAEVPTTDENPDFSNQESSEQLHWNSTENPEIPETLEPQHEEQFDAFTPNGEESPGFSQPLQEQPVAAPPVFDEVKSQDEAADESVAFDSNSEVTTGTGFYQINIEGIDSADIRKNVLNSLLDHRLGLVNNEIAETISGGQLSIRGLNAIKASFIINSLKALPIELKWKVYAESNSES